MENKPIDRDLDEKVSIDLTLGHLILIWETLSSKIACDPYNKDLSEIEKKIVWALEDICEDRLADLKCGPMPEKEWEALLEKARNHIKEE